MMLIAVFQINLLNFIYFKTEIFRAIFVDLQVEFEWSNLLPEWSNFYRILQTTK